MEKLSLFTHGGNPVAPHVGDLTPASPQFTAYRMAGTSAIAGGASTNHRPVNSG